MPTLGNTAKPMNLGEIWGLNTKNQHATPLTLPSGGPWRISQLGAWMAGSNSSPECYLCLWDGTGVLLRAAGPFYPTNYAPAHGNWDQQNGNITPIDLAGGTAVYVGWARHASGAEQFGTYAGGQHLDQNNAPAIPTDLDSSWHAGEISAFLFYEAANNPPTPATNMNPAGGAVIHTGRSISYSFTYNDPDGGTFGQVFFELYLGATLIDSAYVNATSFTRTLPAGYDANVTYQWRVTYSDPYGEWSGWSAFASFRPNTTPNAPGVNAPATNTLTPTLSGGFSDPDPGDTLSAFQIVLYRWTGSAWVLHWTSAETAAAGSTWSKVYDGPALAWGTSYYYQARVRDGLSRWSAYGALAQWLTVEPTAGAPGVTLAAGKQNDTTPDITLTHAQAFDDHVIELYLPGAGSPFQTIGPVADYAAVTSKVVAVDSALTPGTTYQARAQVKRDSDNVWSAWSGFTTFYINANPTSPTASIAADPVAGNQTVTSGTGVLVTTDPTPRWSAPFVDPDKVAYGDAPSARSIEIRRKDTQAALAGYPITTGTAETDLIITALTADLEYEIRVGYRDNAGWPAGSYAYSAWRTIKYSTAPVVGLTAPTEASSVADSTPLLDWTFAGAAGKAQQKYRIRIFDKGPTGDNYANEALAHDSGERIGADTSYSVPFGILVTAHDYRWTVDVWDTDGLLKVLA